MKGRRLAALLCVLLSHALVIIPLLELRREQPREPVAEFDGAPITYAVQMAALEQTGPTQFSPDLAPVPFEPREPVAGQVAGVDESSQPTDTSGVDWPLEGKKAAARVLAREAEAVRIARMFAGPGGTWASLTKRQKSKLNKFRFRPGIDGLEYDSQGNQIYHISDGCVIVNSMFFACAIGKPKLHDDMFDNMREYFDEQRLPQTPEGNGTEPEALRPPY
jgi:hypothetical protein